MFPYCVRWGVKMIKLNIRGYRGLIIRSLYKKRVLRDFLVSLGVWRHLFLGLIFVK